ncbi:MAG TPA: AMP-binding protein [Capillimicrobium sp.]|nr:AMP-binding protein [Capillimicrobium sp.]
MRPTRPADPAVAAAYRAAGHWRDRTIGEHLAWCVREFGDRVAFVDGDRRVTFAELDAEIGRMAGFLVQRGVRPGDVVSFQLPNVLASVVTFYATIRIGAVTNPIVPIYRGHELRHILGQARTKVAVVPASFRGFDYAGLYRRLRPELPDLDTVVLVGAADAGEGEWLWDEIGAAAGSAGGEPPAPALAPADPDDVALLLYTSGTTAAPKGALHTHNTLLFQAHLIADWARLDERDTALNVSPVTHATGILNGLLMPMVTGATVVLQAIWDAREALALIERERVTYMMIATPFLRGLVAELDASGADVSSLRRIGCGGADIPVALMREATERLCPGVIRVYGATEGFTVSSSTRWDPPAKRVATEGRWLPSYEGLIVDESGRPLPAGAVGELHWSGAGMFQGFLDPSLNDDAFTPEGRYRSGDLGRLDEDGYLTITGRLKDVINRSGEKISAYEVEQLLAEHPAVREVAVVAQPDPVTGERACAWVALQPGASLTLDEIADFLITREVAKQKIPEDLAIVDDLPKNAAGKVQKTILRERSRERVADRGQPAETTTPASR